MRVEKLRGHEQANALVRYEGDNIILQSYQTDVLVYSPKDMTIQCNGLYSMTTRKHIGWFMSQFITNNIKYNDSYGYYDIKDAYENNNGLLELYIQGGN